jgi:hypothetical protein
MKNVERFYKWLEMCKNVHLADKDQVERAIQKIPLT